MMPPNILDLIEKSMVNRSAERPLEYSFVWSYLAPLVLLPNAYRYNIKILDVGGAESRLAKTLAELGFDTTVIDIAEVDYQPARFVKADLLVYEFPDETFDIIIAISTLEHVGLPCYGQRHIDERGDVITMEKMHRWLKPHGLAVITLPYGKPHHPPTFERVYNKESLKERIISDKWNVLKMDYGCDDNGWRSCSEHETINRDAVVMLLLQKK